MRGRIAAVMLGLGLSASSASDARAQAAATGSVPLRWQVPAGCPAEPEVGQRLDEALAGRDVVPSVEVVVERSAEGFVAELVLEGPWGRTRRQLDSDSCDTLADAVVLLAEVSARDHERASVSAVVPEPRVVLSEEPRTEPSSVEVEPSTADVTPESEALDEPLGSEPESEPESATDGVDEVRRFELLARLEGRLGSGVLPSLDAGLGGAVGVAGRWARVEVGAGAWLPRQTAIAPLVELDLRLWTGELRGCGGGALPRLPWLRPMACAGIEVGALRGRGLGSGLARSESAVRTWVAAVVSSGVAIRPWRRVGFSLGGALVVPVRRIRFTLRGAGEVYRTPILAGRGFAGVEVYFL